MGYRTRVPLHYRIVWGCCRSVPCRPTATLGRLPYQAPCSLSYQASYRFPYQSVHIAILSAFQTAVPSASHTAVPSALHCRTKRLSHYHAERVSDCRINRHPHCLTTRHPQRRTGQLRFNWPARCHVHIASRCPFTSQLIASAAVPGSSWKWATIIRLI